MTTDIMHALKITYIYQYRLNPTISLSNVTYTHVDDPIIHWWTHNRRETPSSRRVDDTNI